MFARIQDILCHCKMRIGNSEVHNHVNIPCPKQSFDAFGTHIELFSLLNSRSMVDIGHGTHFDTFE